MAEEPDRLPRFVRSTLQSAGRQLAEAKRAYEIAKVSAQSDLPQEKDGRARLVCRRYADQRAVQIDERGRPACFDAEHPDCQGCREDVLNGTVETW